MPRESLIEVGEVALLLRPRLSADVLGLLRRAEATPHAGLVELVPGADSLLLVFAAPTAPRDHAFALALLAAAMPVADLSDEAAKPPSEHRVAVVYDGPDLPCVARATGLRVDERSDLHRAAEYRVAFLGFQPGFAYLSGLPTRLHAARRPSPRPRVPAGSLGIGGEWTGFYPSASPGGWNLIGHTKTWLFDPSRAEPTRMLPGDIVRMVPA